MGMLVVIMQQEPHSQAVAEAGRAQSERQGRGLNPGRAESGCLTILMEPQHTLAGVEDAEGLDKVPPPGRVAQAEAERGLPVT